MERGIIFAQLDAGGRLTASGCVLSQRLNTTAPFFGGKWKTYDNGLRM